MKDFASDNHAGICPESWAAMADANHGYADAYGNDDLSTRAADRVRALFDTDCEVFFVLNGTAANALALAALSRPYHAVICADSAHINTSECSSPQLFTPGMALLPQPATHGKLTLDNLHAVTRLPHGIHQSKPGVLSLAQSTELGTTYTPQELRALSDFAHQQHWKVHLDGARFANACAYLDCTPADISWKAGVDVLCFGGTKNGIGLSEALVFFDKEAARDFAYRRKQGAQLASKMRFLSAAWLGALDNNVWLKHAHHANQMTQRLYSGIQKLPGFELLAPVESNGVFAKLPASACTTLRANSWQFYDFHGGVRLMCGWATTEAQVDAFIHDITQACKNV